MEINKPRFELTSVYTDGSADEPKIVPINEIPLDTNTNRRGFLGAGLVAGAALTLLGKSKLFANDFKRELNTDFEGKPVYAHCDSIFSLIKTQDETTLISGSKDGSIKLWSLPDGKLLKTFSNYGGWINALAVTPDGMLLVSAAGKTISIWSLPEAELLKTINGHTDNIETLFITSDGKMLASGSWDNTIKLWSLPDGALLKTLEGHSDRVTLLKTTLDDKLLISGSWDSTIRLWSLPDGNLSKTIKAHSSIVFGIQVSPDDKILASFGGLENTIKLWSLPKGNIIKVIRGHSDHVDQLFISPDGKLLVSGSPDNTIKLWSLPNGNLLKTLKGFSQETDAFLCSNDNKLLVSSGTTSSFDFFIKIWSIPDGKLLKVFTGHTGGIRDISIVGHERILVSSGTFDRTIRLWDLEKKEFIGFLFDPACNEEKGVTYNVYDKVTNTTHTYTLPCGSPIPAGAVCTCNCVAGTYRRPTYTSPSTICTCNQVCTCVPICQAHKLLHPDKFVRKLAREILLFMGIKEIEYINWAADNSKAELRTVITTLIEKIKRGVKPSYQHWPAVTKCKQYLQHSDEVISIMAAQMINMQCSLNRQEISQELHQKVMSLLIRSKEMNWKANQEHGYK